MSATCAAAHLFAPAGGPVGLFGRVQRAACHIANVPLRGVMPLSGRQLEIAQWLPAIESSRSAWCL
jgi:hypothetical protein